MHGCRVVDGAKLVAEAKLLDEVLRKTSWRDRGLLLRPCKQAKHVQNIHFVVAVTTTFTV